VGTSSFTATGWRGTFYPEGMKAADYLSYYASQFDTVEIDSTWYGIPSEKSVKRWNAQTPDDFVFSAKVPQIVTHERCLENCDAEMSEFLKVMEHLGHKAGALIFQFPYFKRETFATADPFIQRLRLFLKKLPTGFRYAIEIRNRQWITPELQELLRAHGVSMALVDHPWMPTASEYFSNVDPMTADFGYVRMLGDRYEIEEKTKTWDKVVVDRSVEIGEWTKACETITKRGSDVFVYINNHYSGHAPATVREFLNRWKEKHPADMAERPKTEERTIKPGQPESLNLHLF
jgi:uncharacterized protein YecE (DUF72 family)